MRAKFVTTATPSIERPQDFASWHVLAIRERVSPSRPVAFVFAGDMAVAYFMAHAPKSFFPTLNGGQLALLFCFVFLYLAVAGGGPWSVDEQVAARR